MRSRHERGERGPIAPPTGGSSPRPPCSAWRWPTIRWRCSWRRASRSFVIVVDPGVVRRPRLVLTAIGLVAGGRAPALPRSCRCGRGRSGRRWSMATRRRCSGFLYIVLGQQFGGSVVDPFADLSDAATDLVGLIGGQFGPLALLLPVGFIASIRLWPGSGRCRARRGHHDAVRRVVPQRDDRPLLPRPDPVLLAVAGRAGGGRDPAGVRGARLVRATRGPRRAVGGPDRRLDAHDAVDRPGGGHAAATRDDLARSVGGRRPLAGHLGAEVAGPGVDRAAAGRGRRVAGGATRRRYGTASSSRDGGPTFSSSTIGPASTSAWETRTT